VIADKMGLTEEDLRAKIPSGAALLASRVRVDEDFFEDSG
jgi:hypothetical protein